MTNGAVGLRVDVKRITVSNRIEVRRILGLPIKLGDLVQRPEIWDGIAMAIDTPCHRQLFRL